MWLHINIFQRICAIVLKNEQLLLSFSVTKLEIFDICHNASSPEDILLTEWCTLYTKQYRAKSGIV